MNVLSIYFFNFRYFEKNKNNQMIFDFLNNLKVLTKHENPEINVKCKKISNIANKYLMFGGQSFMNICI